MVATVTSEPVGVLAGPVPPPVESRTRVLLVGTAFACAAIAMMFVGLIGVYLSMRTATLTAGTKWIVADVVMPLTQPNMMLFTLVLSVFTIQWAVVSIKNDDRPNTYLALGVSLLLAFSFLVEGGYLYSLMKWNLMATAPQATLIYAITGAQVAMVISAMVFVILMAFRAFAGSFSSRQHDGIAAAALYWHVMVGLYAVIWFAIFVTK